MPVTDETLKVWLEDLHKAGSLSDDDRKALEVVLDKPQAAEFVKGSVLRQADYSRRMSEVDKAKAEFAEKEANVLKLQQDLVNWQGTYGPKYQKTVKELEEANTKLFQQQQRLKTLADTYGIDPTELGIAEGAPPVAAPPKPEPQKDQPRYLTPDDGVTYLKVQARLMRLAGEHQKLFGEPLDTEKLLEDSLEENRRGSNKKMDEVWRERYKVDEKLEAIRQKDIEDRITRAREEERTKVLSEHKLPPTVPAFENPQEFLTKLPPPPKPGDAKPRAAWQEAAEAVRSGQIAKELAGQA